MIKTGRMVLRQSGSPLVLILLILIAHPAAAKGPRFPLLLPGVPQEGVIEPSDANGSFRTFLLDVPDSAAAIRIRISAAAADLDIYLRHGSEMKDYDEADFAAETDLWLEELLLHRAYETWLPAGRYWLDVAYTWDELPRENGMVIDSIPFTVEYTLFDTAASWKTLRSGEVTEAVLEASNAHLAHFRLDLPSPRGGFRVDVLDTPGDIDLYLSAGSAAPARDGYLATAETYLGRESLKIDPDTVAGVAGPFYLTIVEATYSEHPVPVRLTLTAGAELGTAAPAPAPIPVTAQGVDAARLATVQLVSVAGIASGCLVSPDGLILTNDHAVLDDSGRPVEEIVVAMALEAFEAPVELFTARVVERSPGDDLALLRIAGDRWGRPLPAGYRFPHWLLGDSRTLSIGDTLVLTGYPWMGSGLSRSYLTLTRGVLSGGERSPSGLILKTDAVIAGGSSGGAVSDGRWRLLGLPTFVVSQDAAQLTYFVPVERIPAAWRRMFPVG